MRKKILIVGMLNSIHLVRWLNQFKNEDLDFYLFPSTPIRKYHPQILELIHGKSIATYKLAWPSISLIYLIGIADYFIFGFRIFGRILARKINEIVPDAVHIHEFQHAGYIFLNSLRTLRTIPGQVIGSNWGSDIFWFQRFPKHKKRLTELMSHLTHYSAECFRDVELAKALGFKGHQMPIVPNSGGFQIRESNNNFSRAASTRKIIAVKGYTRFVGQAEFAIEVLSKIPKNIACKYEVVIYSSSYKSWFLSKIRLNNFSKVTNYRPHKLSHSQMIELFESARIYLGASKSDGISTSMLESMYSGAFPLQSNTACAEEWLINNETGFLLDLDDLQNAVENCIVALTNNELVDKAQELNFQKIENLASSKVIHSKLKGYYSTN